MTELYCLLFLLVSLIYLLSPISSVNSSPGLWYINNQPPDFIYDSVAYANMTVRIMRSFHDGPGQHLVTDPLKDTNEDDDIVVEDDSNLLFVGNTINRQAFDTQFILDIEKIFNVDRNRIFVLYVSPGDVHYTWEASSVIVNFIITEKNITSSGNEEGAFSNYYKSYDYNNNDAAMQPNLLEIISQFTLLLQLSTSNLYENTKVLRDLDPLYGLQINGWDISLKTFYSIASIGDGTLYSYTHSTEYINGLIKNINDVGIPSKEKLAVIGEDEELLDYEDIVNEYNEKIRNSSVIHDGYYLPQGGLRICDLKLSENNTVLVYISESDDMVLLNDDDDVVGNEPMDNLIDLIKKHEAYCEFERMFEEDVSNALNISLYRVRIMMVKSMGLDSSIVYFRILPSFVEREPTGGDGIDDEYEILPPPPPQTEIGVSEAVGLLNIMVNDYSSPLYSGNVTIRLDPTWGVSKSLTTIRKSGALFTQKNYEYDPNRLNNVRTARSVTSYDRCKANRRCNWGITEHYQNTNHIRFYHRLFDEGTLYENVQLYLDFEDWRIGLRGFTPAPGYLPVQSTSPLLPFQSRIRGAMHGQTDADNPDNEYRIRGAHFWPFDEKLQNTLGPIITAPFAEQNEGLVLNRDLLYDQIIKQGNLLADLNQRLAWILERKQDAKMDAIRRTRLDVERFMYGQYDVYKEWYDNEMVEMKSLNSSQCISIDCELTFDTSNLKLTGAITGNGVVMKTKLGTEVAVFPFNSIFLGPEVRVKVIGQRALSLVSTSTAVINTTIIADPGTLGGFPGGQSVARLSSDMYSNTPTSLYICNLDSYCTDYLDESSEEEERVFDEPLVSNNVNGPGSGNLRVHPYIFTTHCDQLPQDEILYDKDLYVVDISQVEVQSVTTDAFEGQTLGGGFTLSYLDYKTPIIPHDVNPIDLKTIIEENLNIISPSSSTSTSDRIGENAKVAGIGIVEVTRSVPNSQEGFTWFITFVSAIGNVEQITAESFLTGNGASIRTDTIKEGNQIGGTFTLKFGGYETAPIPHDAQPVQVKEALLQLPPIVTAWVDRSDPTGNCNDGLCSNSPYPQDGYKWTLFFTTDATSGDNRTPTSPTSPDALLPSENSVLTANVDNLTGDFVKLRIYFNTETSPNYPYNMLKVTKPFSLAYGGGGGSYGGKGGRGFSDNPEGYIYNDDFITDLLGGSGGCMSAPDPIILNSKLGPSQGNGGAGGGAIEIIAANDIIIGNYGYISVKGGDGEQTSQGGGGGGSGGAVLLSSATSILVLGKIDSSGGNGGFGGFKDLGTNAGGGGGGGRLSLYATSVTVKGDLISNGGTCGIYKKVIRDDILYVNITTTLFLPLILDDLSVRNVGQLHLKNIFNTTSSDSLYQISNIFDNLDEDVLWHYTTYSPFTLFLDEYTSEFFLVDVSYQLKIPRISDSSIIPDILTDLDERLNLNQDSINHYFTLQSEDSKNSTIDYPVIGLVYYIGSEIQATNFSIAEVDTRSLIVDKDGVEHYIDEIDRDLSSCLNHGQDGSIYSEAYMTTSMYIRGGYSDSETTSIIQGAEYTQRALFISNRESTITSTGSVREAPYSNNGPILSFEPSRPSRITYYTKVDFIPGESKKSDFGALFSLISHGEVGLNSSNVIGVFFGDKIYHGANFGNSVDESVYLKRLVTLDPYPNVDVWYKVDIKIQWESKTYSVALNDTIMTYNQKFEADDVDAIGISVWRSVDVWVDEIYVGFDNTMNFTCPISNRAGTSTLAPEQKGWDFDEVHGANNNGYTQYEQMNRHYNFLDTTGTIPFDGQGKIVDFQDIKNSFENGDYLPEQGKIHAGALVYLTGSLRSKKTPLQASQTLAYDNGLWFGGKYGSENENEEVQTGDGRHFWYTEYDFNSTITSDLSGGIAACSTQDMITWRFEGIVFHYTNISDMVFGNPGPFILQRPKVLFNSMTNEYVMWATMDRVQNRSLAMAAIASSPYEDGPFLFRRSFYPDGNQTRDQVIYLSGEDTGRRPILARTYYQTVEFLLPTAIMQPIWESAKTRNGVINFRSNFHRAFYEIAYDNYNDIFDQRWRMEDVEYKVICEDKLTGIQREVPSGTYNSDGFICDDPREKKIVIGQGNPIIKSRFVSPNDTENSWWRPSSVPGVFAQDWSANYRDGYCGIRELNDDYDRNDPNLAKFEPFNRSSCSNIADNPLHDNFPDKLIGVQKVVLTRRAKFVALSLLTDDYLDTTGILTTFEGELESGNLISLITNLGQFGWVPGEQINSTFQPPKRSEFKTAVDYRVRFSQYIRNFNDRASYSLACVLDGFCPVNFRDQITEGHA